MEASVRFDTNFNSGMIDRRIFSGFLEHLGRAIYGGVFDPDSPLSNENGFRTDVVQAMQHLQMPFVRYPGGNFVSNYDWRDGVGSERKGFPDFAWKATEPNLFGTDEFIHWSREVGTNPMLAVNLGTLGPSEAAALVEYCNLNTATHWAAERRRNGNLEPHNVKVWCLGNEMDGPWQAGHMPAEQYALKARNAARLMKGIDPTIELVAAGSSGRFMPTYMEWDRTVLETCWEDIDYVSAHRYANNTADDTPAYLSEGLVIDQILDDYSGLLSYVKALKKSKHDVYLSFDEWNVWYRERGGKNRDGDWQVGPTQLEEIYNLEDALVCAQFVNSFIRRADLVKIACLAQIVNVIAPILTSPDGLLYQSIYYPFQLYSQMTRGLSLTPSVMSETYEVEDIGEVPFLDVSASYDPEDGDIALFLVNRSIEQELHVNVEISDLLLIGAQNSKVLSGDSPKSANSWEQPDVLKVKDGKVSVEDRSLRLKVPRLGMVAVGGIKSRKR